MSIKVAQYIRKICIMLNDMLPPSMAMWKLVAQDTWQLQGTVGGYVWGVQLLVHGQEAISHGTNFHIMSRWLHMMSCRLLNVTQGEKQDMPQLLGLQA